MRVLIGCEYSGRVRRAFHDRGHFAVSCDLLPSEEPWYGFNPWHYQGSIFDILERKCPPFWQRLNEVEWDLAIFHPPCTYLANSGVRWLHKNGSLDQDRWQKMMDGAAFYCALRNAPIPKKCIENPVMHCYARTVIEGTPWPLPLVPSHRQVVQPWWFGEPFFKATGFELIGLPDLVPTNKLVPPKPGTAEHKAWSAVHRASPGPDRWKERSRTYVGVAEAMAAQWS